jgi:hypothetical protein
VEERRGRGGTRRTNEGVVKKWVSTVTTSTEIETVQSHRSNAHKNEITGESERAGERNKKGRRERMERLKHEA